MNALPPTEEEYKAQVLAHATSYSILLLMGSGVWERRSATTLEEAYEQAEDIVPEGWVRSTPLIYAYSPLHGGQGVLVTQHT